MIVMTRKKRKKKKKVEKKRYYKKKGEAYIGQEWDSDCSSSDSEDKFVKIKKALAHEVEKNNFFLKS
jgi:hypothetical protein